MKVQTLAIILSTCQFVSSLKCYLTDYPGPKDCSLLMDERRSLTDLACLSAVVLDSEFLTLQKYLFCYNKKRRFSEYDNPEEIRECSKDGGIELPGGCELLRKKRIVKSCFLCHTDYCNVPEVVIYNEASAHREVLKLFPILLLFTVICLTSLHC